MKSTRRDQPMKFLKSFRNVFFGLTLLAWSGLQFAQTNLPACKGNDVRQWHSCRGVIDDDEYSYAGDFMMGKFDGRGILEFTADKYQGDHYQGEFKNGLKHGFGMYFFSNGDKYVGEYQFGKRDGKGTYSFSNGKPALTGIWSNNAIVTKTSNSQNANNKVNDLQNPDFEKKKIETLRSSILRDRAADKSDAHPPKVIGKVRDAVAIVIGVQNYKNLPHASYAINDANQFKEHAVRYLGVKPENVKLLADSNANRADILLAFKYWLPAHINAGKTDVFIYYSGHGLVEGQSAPKEAKAPSAEVAALLGKANCASCHGANFSMPIDPSYPKIGGQHADYLYVALKSYKNNENAKVGRSNAIMAGMAKHYSNAELKQLANYLASVQGDLKVEPQSRWR